MGVMSIRVNDEKRKKIKAIASLQGKTIGGLVEELIDRYIEAFQNEKKEEVDLREWMKVSEPSFDEWDNPEDKIYDDL